jgi:hypothetical protein
MQKSCIASDNGQSGVSAQTTLAANRDRIVAVGGGIAGLELVTQLPRIGGRASSPFPSRFVRLPKSRRKTIEYGQPASNCENVGTKSSRSMSISRPTLEA